MKNGGFERTRKARNVCGPKFSQIGHWVRNFQGLMIAKSHHTCNLASVESAVMMASELCVEVMVLGCLVCVAEL